MTDDEILAIVDRRLGRVEPMVPPLALAGVQPSPAAPVVRGPLRPIPGAPVAILMLVIVAFLVVAVFQRPVVDLGAAPGNSAIASASQPGGTPSPAPSASPPPSASLEIVRGEGSGEFLMFRRLGWVGMCLMGADALVVAIDPTLIDRAAEAAGVEEGWVDVGEFGRFWIGTDVERAAAGIGASMLVIGDQGDPWIFLGGAARRFVANETPAGRTYWRAMGAIRPCDSPGKPSAENR